MPLDNAGDAESKPRSLVVGPCVLSFPTLFVPKQVLGEGPLYYSATFIFDPKLQKSEIERLVAAATAAADAKWPDGAWKKKRALKDPTVFHWPIFDGDRKSERRGYAGMIYVSARTREKPGVVDQNVQPVLDTQKIYPGLIVNASINFFGYDKPRWGVGCGLNNVQIVRDGERLGGKPDPSDDFVPIGDPDNDNNAQKGWLA